MVGRRPLPLYACHPGGLDALRAEAERRSPGLLERLSDPRNPRRVLRALERLDQGLPPFARRDGDAAPDIPFPALDIPQEVLAPRIAARTRHLARRQRTWFRHKAVVEWVAGPLDAADIPRAADDVERVWRLHGPPRPPPALGAGKKSIQQILPDPRLLSSGDRCPKMDIVEELRQNRESGAKRLVSEYKAGLMSLACRFYRNVGDAEELVNATFAKVVENIDDYLEQSAFFAWMSQILTNEFRDRVRRKSNKMEVYPGVVPEVADESAQRAIFASLDASLLREAIETLPEDIKKTVLLHYFMDMPVKEVARVLSSPTSTITWRLHYARQILAAKLGAATKKPGGKVLLIALALATLTAIGAAVATLGVPRSTSSSPSEDALLNEGGREVDLSFMDNCEQLSFVDNDKSNCSQTFANDNCLQTTEAASSAPPATTIQLQENAMKQTTAKTTATRSFAAVTALAVATGLPMRAAAASGDTLCYKPDSGQTAYPWDNLSWWFTGTDSSAPNAAALPTASENVLLYSSKNAVSSSSGKPMIITNGVTAKTKDLTICKPSNSPNATIGVEVQGGGAMETAGFAYIGAVTNNQTGGGALRILSDGIWTAKKNFFLAYTGGNSRLDIADGGTFSALKELIVGNGGNGVVTNAGTLLAYDFFVGGSNGVGRVVNRGDLTVTNKLTIGRMAGSSGYLVHEAGTLTKTTTSDTTPVYVGYRGPGVLEVHGVVSLPQNERIYLGGNEKGAGEGTIILCEGGSINNVTNIFIGSASNGARGHLQMAGGTLTILTPWPNTHHALLVGKISDSTGEQRAWGDIRGHGTIARSRSDRSTRIKLYGQVVADGGDLYLSSIKTIGEADVDANVCGTNGWYAVNGGRLFYPTDQDFNATRHVAIGDYPTCGIEDNTRDITLVNSLQLRLYDAAGNQLTDSYYNHAALYAADRNDIPGTVPGSASNDDITLGIWRLGHFDAPGDIVTVNAVSFDKVWLRFRVDAAALPDDIDWSQFKVRLYRWDGSAWQIVGKADGVDMPYVETRVAQPAYAGVDADGKTWNIGWYAAALVRNGAFTLIIR